MGWVKNCTAERWPCDCGHVRVRCGCNECFALQVLTKIVCVETPFFPQVSRANCSSLLCYVQPQILFTDGTRSLSLFSVWGVPSCYATAWACITKFMKSVIRTALHPEKEWNVEMGAGAVGLHLKNSLPHGVMQFRGHEDLPSWGWAPRL